MGVSSEEELANLALLRLGEPEITTLSTSETGRNVEVVDALYDQNRDWCLTLVDWGCALRREHLVRAASIAISAITQASPAVVTISGHTYQVNDLVTLEQVGGMTSISSGTYIVGAIATDTIDLYTTKLSAVDSSNYSAYTSGGSVYRSSTNDWQRAYDMPSDALRVVDILDEEWAKVPTNLWIREKGVIYTDLYYAGMLFVQQLTDPSVYDEDLIELMVARLAWQIAPRITKDMRLREELYADFLRVKASVERRNSSGREERGAPETEWVDVH